MSDGDAHSTSGANLGGDRQTVGGRPARVALNDLRLDYLNPRLPRHMQGAEKSQTELLLYMDKKFNPLEVAQSIARHGYFESEPMIAMPQPDGTFVVLEGNRRLSALMGLHDPAQREVLSRQTRAWRSLPQVTVPEELPVVLVDDREKVAPLLGFRHISGIKEWEAFAQAKYIVGLVESGKSLQEVAELVGRPLSETRAMYRDHEIIAQAREEFLLDTQRVEADFGVFNAAMDIRNLRNYIDAPTPARVNVIDWPLPDSARERLERLLGFMYGDESGAGKVLPESRFLRTLGLVLADPSGRGEAALLGGADLDEALEAVSEPGDRFTRRLQTAMSALSRAESEQPPTHRAEDAQALTDIAAIVERLRGGRASE